MKTRWFRPALGLVALLVSCSESADFTTTTHKIVEKPVEEEQRAQQAEVVAEGKPEPTPIPTSVHEVNVKSRETNNKDSAPVELLFILDNSRSMDGNITDLQAKVPALFASLKEQNVRYNARILTLDKFIDQLSTVDNPRSKAPFGVVHDGPVNYTGRIGYDSSYIEVEPFIQNYAVEDIGEAIANAILPDRAIFNEPGICAAIDYINWVSFSGDVTDPKLRFTDEQNLHVILLSDEDNAKVFEDIDTLTGIVKEKLNIYCYQKRKETDMCSRHNIELNWEGFGYSYREKPTTQYRYDVTYYEPSVCQQRGVPFPDGNDYLVRIAARQHCERKLLACEDHDDPDYSYQCSTAFDGEFEELFPTNKEAQNIQRCKAIQQFECEGWNFNRREVKFNPKTRQQAFDIMKQSDRYFRCQADTASLEDPYKTTDSLKDFPQEVEFSYEIIRKNQDWSGSRQRCRRPKTFNCTQYDEMGNPKPVRLPYKDVVPFAQKLGGESYICQAEGFQGKYSGDKGVTHKLCQVHHELECQRWEGTNKVFVEASREEAMAILNNPTPQQRYQCASGGLMEVTVTNIATTHGTCQVPTEVECETLIDGEPVWVRVSWEDARGEMERNPAKKCRKISGQPIDFVTVKLAQDSKPYLEPGRYLADSCEAYSCNDISQLECRVKQGSNPIAELVEKSALVGLDLEKHFIDSCEVLSCEKVANTTCDTTPVNYEFVHVGFPNGTVTNPDYFYDSCAVFSCTDEGERECRVPDGVVATPMDFAPDDPQLEEKEQYFIESCTTYICDAVLDGYRRVQVTPEVKAANGDRYQNCRDVNPAPRPMFEVEANNDGSFKRLKKKNCADYGAGYRPASDNKTLHQEDFCESLVKQKLTAQGIDPTDPGVGIVLERTGAVSTPETKEIETGFYGSTQSEQALEKEYDLLPGAIREAKPETKTTTGGMVRRYFVYNKYPPGSPERTAIEAETLDFTEILEGDFIGPQKVLYNSAEYIDKFPRNGAVNEPLSRDDPIWEQFVTETKVPDPAGIFEEGCEESKVEVTHIRPTAQSFVSLMKELYPKRTFTWHSIVNLDGEQCAGEDNTNVTKGTEYLKLTDLTQGVKGSICETSSEGLTNFIREVANQVINEVDLVYELPAGVQPQSIAGVVNQTTGKTLIPDQDYILDVVGSGDKTVVSIIFTKGVVAEADVVSVQYQ